MASLEAYLDNSATTKTLPQVNAAMEAVLTADYGNPSSLHRMGIQAEEQVEEARKTVARALGCKKNNIVFTSGGTESNNLALIGYFLENKRKGTKLVTNWGEHPSVLRPVEFLSRQGLETVMISPDRKGDFSFNEIGEAIDENTALVSFMQVNNETGKLTDIAALSRFVKEKNPQTVIHCDGVQSFLKVPCSMEELGVDLFSVSAHKVNGPKGVGALYVKDGVRLSPLLFGGGQEKGFRSGTENTAGIAGFGAAVKEHLSYREQEQKELFRLRKRLLSHLSVLEELQLHTDLENSAPHLLNLSFLGIRSEILLHTLEEFGVFVSSGSACAANSAKKKKVLERMGHERAVFDSAIRFSLSSLTTQEEIDYGGEVIVREVINLRKRLNQ